ncbi:transposable element Tcb2 transposase [Trichonephila clavipes]|nr:transposable element Tcb2 transposase [Trichonephila clavipes]
MGTTPNEDRYLVLTARRYRNMNTTLLNKYFHSATGTTVSTQTVQNRLHGVGLYAHRLMCQIWRWGVLVYGGTSIDGRTDLYIIRDGPLTARRYRDEILRPIVVPYAAAIGDDFILMDDNCRLSRANLVKDFRFEEGIVRMEWLAGRWQRSHQRINEGDGNQRADARRGGRRFWGEKKEQPEQRPSRDPPPVVHKRDA